MKQHNSILILSLTFIAIFLTACGSDNEINTDYSMLTLAEVKQTPLAPIGGSAFSLYLKNGIRLRLDGTAVYDDLVEANVAAASASSGHFSTTNLHESGVDESDRLKYDGEYMYLIKDHYYPVAEGKGELAVSILETDSENASAEPVGSINRSSSELVNIGLYLEQNTRGEYLVSLSSTRFYYWFDFLIDIGFNWHSGKSLIELHNIQDKANPQLDWQIEIEGNLEGSRKINNKLYLITRFVPSIEGLNFNPQTEQEKQANELLIRNTSVNNLLPSYRINQGELQSLVAADDCLVAGEPESTEGYADIITLSSFDLETQELESSVCLNANVHGIYSSVNNLYIGASANVDWWGGSGGTSIHKFALLENGVTYRASGFVQGGLGWNDPALRMSELNDDLRIVTSEQLTNGTDIENRLFVLRDDNSGQLNVIGQLPNQGRPSAIGKPGEDIFAVRFVENDAYIITFERVDPLYHISLEEPMDPYIVSELEMPGFARYLHPISENWLLGIGRHIENGNQTGVKVELYDLRDAEAPQVVDTQIIGGRGSWSEAEGDLRAFSILAVDDDTLQLTVPVSRSETNTETGYQEWRDNGLYLFEISGLQTEDLRLIQQGALISETSDDSSYPLHWGQGRGVLHDQAIYFYQGNQLWGALQGDLSIRNGPYY
ncbi:MAG: beta-propeller domain-containing protein [Kangiellaceae bacterium]|nr:beta-propeller domain-containing protein [Kangiellaceae bacterium]MCW9015598.1 beta-propeller domain-containing protein [Kangiellaceae bacterium]